MQNHDTTSALSLLHQSFLQKNWQESGFRAPTPIQEKVIPLILEGRDVIFQSPTGTGKTLAYLLPILQMIDTNNQNIQAVILAPSRELVMQIHQEIQKWTKGSGMTGASFIGGADIKRQLEKLKTKPQIIVGTTGRILELIHMKKMKMHNVKTIVVDEFDTMLTQEHIKAVSAIIKSTQSERRLVFLSATLSEKVEQAAKEWAKEAYVVQVQQDNSGAANVEHMYVLCEQREKIDMLRRIIHLKGVKALAFINDIHVISEVEAKLTYKGINLGVLAGEAKKTERQHALNQIRTGKISLLIATDVGARGLDIEGLTHVIHFELPRDSKQYLHRSGRTGRMGASGTVISIVTRREESDIKKLSRDLGITIHKKTLYKGQIIDRGRV